MAQEQSVQGAAEKISGLLNPKQDNQVSEKIKHQLKSQLHTVLNLTKFLNFDNQPGCEGGCWFDFYN